MSPSRSTLALLVALASATALASQPAGAVPFDAAHDTRCENAALRVVGVVTELQGAAHQAWGGEMPGTGALPQGFGYAADGCSAYKVAADGGTKRVQIFDGGGDDDGRTKFGVSDRPGASRDLNVDFGGSNRAPLQAQIDNANEGPTVIDTPDSDDATLENIPVASVAIAVVVRIPDGCEIPSSSARQLSRVRLEGAFADPSGVRTHPPYDQWYELFGSNIKASPGSPLTDQQCGAKKFRVVVSNPGEQTDDTTLPFKRYLQRVSETGGSGTDWTAPALAETAFPPTPAAVYGGNAAERLGAMDTFGDTGAISYGDLATARADGFGWSYAGGAIDPADRKLWVRVQRVADNAYVSPARVDAQTGTRGARCGSVVYGNLAADTRSTWAAVDAVSTTVDYPLCTLSYLLTWQSPAAAGIANQSRARGRKDYIGYLLGSGQSALVGGDYSALPTAILDLARTGWAELEA
jgi:hypothetical protein